jgi:hypothetical protein
MVGGRPGPSPHYTRAVDRMDARLEDLERRIAASMEELKEIRRERMAEVRERWEETEHKVSAAVAASVSLLFVFSFFFWSVVGQQVDQRALPHGADPLLGVLPLWNLVPVLTLGWLACHVLAIYLAVVYCPSRWAYILATVGLLVAVRTLFVAFNPMGAPPGILSLNASYLLSPLKGILAFENEFFFSGHTALPYLYALIFWPIPWARRTFIGLSILMAASVLLTRNHYTMDILGAYFITYSVYALSRSLLRWLDPEPDWGPSLS